MEEVEAKLRQCRLAQVASEVENRILDRRPQRNRPNWARRFWVGIAASFLVIWMANAWLDKAYDASPYTSAVAARAPADSAELRESEAEVAELLGEVGRDYLAYLRGKGIVRGEQNGG